MESEYYILDNKINELFENKYCNNQKYINFFYCGYFDNNFESLKSEFSYFLLIDKVNQSISIESKFEKASQFLELNNDDIVKLKNDILDLINQEKVLFNCLKINNILPKKNYQRKFYCLSCALETI